MKISTKGRYALRMLADLAQCNRGEYIALKDIAERQNVSKKYLEQIVPILTHAGLLSTNRGYQGGYRLAKDPSAISCGEVLRLTEGSLSPVVCIENGIENNECERKKECVTLPLWIGLSDVINKYLDSVTIRDMIDNFTSRGSDDYVI